MHRVAASVLRGAGLVDLAKDAVQDAIVSIMTSPPSGVRNWEAFMVAAAKRKAIDRCRSAAVVHAGPEFSTEKHDRAADYDLVEDVVEDLERERHAQKIQMVLPVLDERHLTAVWQFVALERPRSEVAAKLGVTPPRVSQMTKSALDSLRKELDRNRESYE
ncbi:sigma-70 family RNA polymerase sigma factor [Arthrobacter sp. AET 35A]|nr:sigma-70 family RNA polymerase sigma factor [Arthrobacter sp. AET 35A]